MPEIDLRSIIINYLNTVSPSTPLVPSVPLVPVPKESTPVSMKPKLCQHTSCKKKLMLSDFACRCTNYYCGAHRHAESHACVYDFKKQGATLLEKQLVKAVASKLDRI